MFVIQEFPDQESQGAYYKQLTMPVFQDAFECSRKLHTTQDEVRRDKILR